jgi:hypothetical protein
MEEDYDCDKIGIPEDIRPKVDWDSEVSIMPMYKKKFYKKTMPGFPDEEISIQQDSGDANLDIWYGTQLYQETYVFHGNAPENNFILQHIPIISGTFYGIIALREEIGSSEKKTLFSVTLSSLNQFQVCLLDSESDLRIISGHINLQTGYVNMVWNRPPGLFEFQIGYEYNR